MLKHLKDRVVLDVDSKKVYQLNISDDRRYNRLFTFNIVRIT
jgi:hypothetical protein